MSVNPRGAGSERKTGEFVVVKPGAVASKIKKGGRLTASSAPYAKFANALGNPVLAKRETE